MLTRISVIIPTYNRGEILSDTIRMAAAQDYADYEVIVVDQNRVVPESVQRVISESGGRVRLLRLLEPSLTAARNAGVRAANGEIVVFIDDDVIIGANYIAGHLKNYQEPAVGGVMGLTLPTGPVQESEAIDNTIRVWEGSEKLARGVVKVAWLIGCNASYRKAAILQAGMSDERFTGSAWYEDADLSVRVRALGYDLLFDPAIRLVHLELSAGGCENRTAAIDEERRIEDRCEKFLFFSLKNRRILGVRKTTRNVWRMYRNSALNRPVLRSWRTALNRQKLFLRGVVGAMRLLRARQTPDGSNAQSN